MWYCWSSCIILLFLYCHVHNKFLWANKCILILMFIVWYPFEFSRPQFTLLVLALFYIQSHLFWGELSICALCCSYSQSLQLRFLVPPGTHHCWVDRGDMIWEASPTPLHMTGSMTRAPVTHPSTKRAQRCLTSVIWRELVTVVPLGHAAFRSHTVTMDTV